MLHRFAVVSIAGNAEESHRDRDIPNSAPEDAQILSSQYPDPRWARLTTQIWCSSQTHTFLVAPCTKMGMQDLTRICDYLFGDGAQFVDDEQVTKSVKYFDWCQELISNLNADRSKRGVITGLGCLWAQSPLDPQEVRSSSSVHAPRVSVS
jgi:hypothetical protein